MPIHDEVRQHAKEMGCEDLLDSLHRNEEPRKLIEKPTKAEVKHRQKRKKKKKMIKASKRKNR